jgi:hypothetical protein
MSKAEMLYELLEKFFGGSSKEPEEVYEVSKALNEEQRTALFLVLEPQAGEMTNDLHSDTYDEDEVRKAAMSFNQHCMKANLFHKVEIEDAKIVESYITPSSFQLDDGRIVKKGSWLQTWFFPKTSKGEELWQMVKNGKIDAVSIQGRALVEDIE